MLAAALLLVPATSGAAPYPPLAEVTVLPYARVLDGGDGLAVQVRILCQPNTDELLWEAYVNASQAGGTEGYVDLMPRTCDGRRHVERIVIDRIAGHFAPGQVRVDFVLVNENTLTVHARDSRTLTAR